MAASTPVSRHTRLRRRPKDSEFSVPTAKQQTLTSPIVAAAAAAGPVTSTPNRATTTTAAFGEKSVNRLCTFRLAEDEDDEEDDDDFFPSSQFQPKKNGEVYWNMDGSPRAQEQLRQWIREADANSPSNKEGGKKKAAVKPTMTRMVLKSRPAAQGDPELQREMLASIQEFYDKMESAKVKEKKQTTTDAEEEAVAEDEEEDKEEGPFGDSADIWLTQAVEMISDKKTDEPDLVTSSSVKCPRVIDQCSDENPFGDDSFDEWLSQADFTPGSPGKVSSVVAKTTSSIAAPSKPFELQSFKRVKSDFGQKPSQPSKADSAWNRTHSSPDVPAAAASRSLFLQGGGKAMRSSTSGSIPRCSKEEIEQKRLAAMNRRKMSQQSKPLGKTNQQFQFKPLEKMP